MTPPTPNLIPLETYPITSNRQHKILKLQVLKQKSMARRRQEEEKQKKEGTKQNGNQDQDNLLQYLDNQKDSQSQASEIQSFDSDVHDVYRLETTQSKFREAHSSEIDQSKILDVKNIKQTGLIIDFKKDQNLTNIKINNSKIPNIAESQQFSTSNIKPIVNQQLSRNDNIEVPQFLRISSPIHKPEKKTSFMEYYNSLSTKSSTNILQKYIKSKKK